MTKHDADIIELATLAVLMIYCGFIYWLFVIRASKGCPRCKGEGSYEIKHDGRYSLKICEACHGSGRRP
jgi:hypothetical protein